MLALNIWFEVQRVEHLGNIFLNLLSNLVICVKANGVFRLVTSSAGSGRAAGGMHPSIHTRELSETMKHFKNGQKRRKPSAYRRSGLGPGNGESSSKSTV
jgi:hypothetical protein